MTTTTIKKKARSVGRNSVELKKTTAAWITYHILPKPDLFSSGKIVTQGTDGHGPVSPADVLWQVDVGNYPTRLVVMAGSASEGRHQRGECLATLSPQFSLVGKENFYEIQLSSLRGCIDTPPVCWSLEPRMMGVMGRTEYRLKSPKRTLKLKPSSTAEHEGRSWAQTTTTTSNDTDSFQDQRTLTGLATNDDNQSTTTIATFAQGRWSLSSTMQVQICAEFLAGSDSHATNWPLLLVVVGSLLVDEQRRFYEVLSWFFCQI